MTAIASRTTRRRLVGAGVLALVVAAWPGGALQAQLPGGAPLPPGVAPAPPSFPPSKVEKGDDKRPPTFSTFPNGDKSVPFGGPPGTQPPGSQQPPPLPLPPPPALPSGGGFPASPPGSGFGPGGGPGPPPTPPPLALSVPASPRFQFTIDPKTPLKDLLPIPPKPGESRGPLLNDDLAQVPEVAFQKAPAKGTQPGTALHDNAHTIAKINHLNQKKTDGFMEALLAGRTDLSGLPFAMGDACRTKVEQSREFTRALQTLRNCLNPGGGKKDFKVPPPVSAAGSTDPAASANFWERYQQTCAQEDKAHAGYTRAQHEHVALARIAALMQVLAPESPAMRKGLVKYLAGVSHPEATRALAKLAIFSAERGVREPAVEALKVRREKDYTAILLEGLRYPLPAVAKRASEALVQLERTDLTAQLVALLDEADPRAPVLREVNKKQVPVVRELVKINHHRNCVLCHSPGNTAGISPEVLTAQVPTPGEPMNPPSQGYQNSIPEVVVRIDVTYLRQDFSVMQPVSDAHPWPAMQRFDFLVRTRALTEKEAEGYRAKLAKRGEGFVTPYQRAVLHALRELTGRDAAPTAEAWRELLGLPVPSPRAEGVGRRS